MSSFIRLIVSRDSSVSVVTMKTAGRLGESELDSRREQMFSVHHTSATAPGNTQLYILQAYGVGLILEGLERDSGHPFCQVCNAWSCTSTFY